MNLSSNFQLYQLGLTDEEGNTLTLTESEEGICQSGSCYDYVKEVIETSLEHFLTDTEEQYDNWSIPGSGHVLDPQHKLPLFH